MAVEVHLMRDSAEEHDLLTDNIRMARQGAEPVRLLEAGCGHYWWLKPAGVPLEITGVDTDADALRIRREEHADLDAEILGDLRTVSLPRGVFDVVYCSYVLEHVEGAEQVLDRMADALRPGGRMIVRVPDGDSVFGYLTKHSPHRIHVLYKKYIERKPHAGEPGHAPYPAVYEPVVTVRGMREWARRQGMEVMAEYGMNFYLKVFGRLRPVAEFGVRMVAWLSRGRLTARHNNVGFVLMKPISIAGS
jgi:SAM-dependent methyltransferase